MGRATHQFAQEWDGSGAGADLVDPVRLRQEWLSEVPSALSSMLLHAAWLSRAEPQAVDCEARSAAEKTSIKAGP